MNAPSEVNLTVIRHGETVWNLQGKQQGHLNSDLSDLGIKQARAVAEALAQERFDAFYSSDLGRALQTAQIINEKFKLEITTDSRLRERHLGILQGLTQAQFQQKYPQVYAQLVVDSDYVIPEGESIRQRHERCIACADELARRHPGCCILIVAHGGILDSFFRHTLGLALNVPRKFSIFNASLNTFTITNGTWRLDSWGDIHHLREIGTMDDW